MFYSTRITKAVALILLGTLLAGMATGAGAVTVKQIKDRGYIRIAVANERPYSFINAAGRAQGFAAATAKHVLKDMGITDIQWSVMPFGQLIHAVKIGMVDMVAAGQAILPRRCEKVLFSQPNITYHEGLLVLAGNPHDIHSYGDIAEKPDLVMGVITNGSEIGVAHAAGIDDSQIVEFKRAHHAIAALANHKIAAYAATQFTVAGMAARNEQVQAVQPYPKKPFPVDPFKDPIARNAQRNWGGFSFAKTSEKLRDAFNNHLQSFQQTDEWLNILKHYGIDQRSIDAIDVMTTGELCHA